MPGVGAAGGGVGGARDLDARLAHHRLDARRRGHVARVAEPEPPREQDIFGDAVSKKPSRWGRKGKAKVVFLEFVF